MKIAFIVNYFPLLSETFILNQITGLLDRGHTVDIFARRPGNEPTVHADVERYNLLKRTHYLTRPSNKIVRMAKSIPIITVSGYRNPKAVFRSLNIFEYGKKALSLNLLYTIAPFLKEYDIIHCQFGPNGNLGALLKEIGVKGKLVTTFHGYDTRLGIEKGGDIYRSLFAKGDCFIAVSGYNYENLIKFGADKNKIIYHPLGINIDRFSRRTTFRPATGDKHKCIRIVTIGRLVEEKGIHYGIQAIRKVVQEHPEINLEYNIIGDGPLKENIATLIQNLNLENIVRLLGSQTEDQIIHELQQSHIFLLPSIAESFGMVLLEAQAAGIPVVATSVGSTSQAIINGKSGFLVPPGNADALADKLEYLIEHPERWPDIGREGRKYVEKNFDLNKLNDRLVQLYQFLLDGGENNRFV